MSEQLAILTHDHGEWIFMTDSEEDEPERAWKDVDAALEELRLKGWEVVQGPAPIRTEMEGLERFNLEGYRLRRRIQ